MVTSVARTDGTVPSSSMLNSPLPPESVLEGSCSTTYAFVCTVHSSAIASRPIIVQYWLRDIVCMYPSRAPSSSSSIVPELRTCSAAAPESTVDWQRGLCGLSCLAQVVAVVDPYRICIAQASGPRAVVRNPASRGSEVGLE